MEFTKKPLYLFDLPKPLLDTLVVKGQQPQIDIAVPETPTKEQTEEQPEESIGELSTGKSTSCGLCNAKFANVQEQRQHVKSDFHKYNLRLKVKGQTPLTENEFEKLVGDLDESISGSDTEEDEEGEEGSTESNMLTNLLKKQAKINDGEPTLETSTSVSPGSPMIWLGSPSLPENFSLGVYKVLFSEKDLANIVNVVREKQLSPVAIKTGKGQPVSLPTDSPSYFLCMIGGGHFAAMVVALAPKMVAKHNATTERQAIVLAHKTFHRYTTRRKQGGSQSASDSAKGAAHSAGANLRRANEAALMTEVRALLEEWKALINNCELVFIRATGAMSRRSIFGPYDGQVLSTKDPRNRGFPFTTRRATQSELMRAFVELTRVKISEIDPTALKEAEAKEKATPKPKPTPKPVAKISPEEEEQLLHTSQLTALIKRTKIPALLSYINNNSIDINKFTLIPDSQYHHTPTLLHYAASTSTAAIIGALLIKASADPTIRSEEGKTAAEISRDRSIRDAFRSVRYQLGEPKFAWDEAGVGSALSPSEAAKQAEKEKQTAEEEKQREAERRQRAMDQLHKQEANREEAKAEKKYGKGQTMSWTEQRENDTRGMTPEMRMRLEREQRARAVEERLKRMAGSK